jgi:hypothetical protein
MASKETIDFAAVPVPTMIPEAFEDALLLIG